MLSSYQIFNNLRGKWTFNRIISDFSNLTLSCELEGTAEFSTYDNDRNQLYYSEKGLFTFPDGKQSEFKKEYLYSYNSNTEKIEKYFFENDAKAGLFYVFGDQLHSCGNDRYKPSCTFPDHENYDSFNLTYDVQGPRKNCRISTNYFKLQSQ
jgi:hypothetical protein